MGKDSRHGQGVGTPRKQFWFARLFRCSLLASRAPSVLDYTYWHADLNCASGWCDKVGCAGSALVFLDEAMKVARSFAALFCDNDADAVAALRTRVKPYFVAGFPSPSARVGYFVGDNALALPKLAADIRAEESLPRFSHGTVLVDSNGFPGGFPFFPLRDFLATHPRMDPIVNVNSSLFARVREAIASNNPNVPNVEAFKRWPVRELGDLPDALARRKWHVVLPPKTNRDKYAIFYGFSGGERHLPDGLLPIDHPAVQAFFAEYRRVDPAQKLFFPDQFNLRHEG